MKSVPFPNKVAAPPNSRLSIALSLAFLSGYGHILELAPNYLQSVEIEDKPSPECAQAITLWSRTVDSVSPREESNFCLV